MCWSLDAFCIHIACARRGIACCHNRSGQEGRTGSMAEAVDKAYRTIRDGIMSGIYPQGAHVTAQDLAEASGLSRTPVREAMRRLHAEGLILIIPNRGAFVARWSDKDIHKIYDLRVLLESHAAEIAATEAGQADI